MSFAVSTRFTGKDLISRTFSRMGKNASKFGGKSTKAFRDASRSASRFQSVTKAILASSAIIFFLATLKSGVSAATTEFIGFDQAVTSASAKFKDVNLATAEGQKRLLELKKTARDVGAVTQFSAGQAAGGLDFLAMAGFNAEQAMAALPGVVDLATVANTDLARATDIASDSLGAFGLMTKDANQLQENFTRVNDVMALTMSRTNTNMEDMFEAVKKGAPDFVKAGQSMESFNALLGVMANSGKKGSEAGTALRNVVLRLADPTKEARKAIELIGIKTADASGNFRDIVDILADVEKGTKGMGEVQKTAALSTIFGARAVGSINILLEEGTDSIRGFRKELINSAGASQKMADIMRTSLGNRLKSLSSAALELGFKFFTAFEKQGGSAIAALTTAVRQFDPTPIINGLKLALDITGKLFSITKSFGPELLVVAGGFLVYGAALKGIAILEAIKGFLLIARAIKAAAAAQGLLNAAMLLNPIGLIIAGIVGVIALFVFLERKFGVLTFIFETLKTWFDIVIGTFKSLGAGKLFEFIGKAFAGVAGIGGDAEGPATPTAVTPPNREEAEARQIAFKGQLDIAGAPAGSTVKSTTRGAAPIDMNLLGANP